MKRLMLLTSLSSITVLVLASSASAQGSFCTSTANASGASVAKCVDAPSSPTASASPEVTVVNGGPQTASPTATVTASASNPVVAAVGGELPPTGGAARLAVLAAILLVGSGAMSYGILRRSN